MDTSDTCWTLIRGAAAQEGDSRAEFARRYAPVIRAFFRARWKRGTLAAEVDDATQEVFVDCFRAGGALERVRADHGPGFRPFLRGVARNVARRFEERAGRRSRAGPPIDLDRLEDEGDAISRVFDRTWARAIMRDAAEHMARMADERGPDAVRRVDLLRLRFQEGLPIRTIAQHWDSDPARIHREYAKARREFRNALVEVVAFHHPGEPEELEAECRKLLELFGKREG